MALGDQAGLAAVQAAVAQIPGLEAFLGSKVNDLHAALAETLTAGVVQIRDTLLKVEAPVLERIDVLNANVSRLLAVAEKFQSFAGGFDISVTPKT